MHHPCQRKMPPHFNSVLVLVEKRHRVVLDGREEALASRRRPPEAALSIGGTEDCFQERALPKPKLLVLLAFTRMGHKKLQNRLVAKLCEPSLPVARKLTTLVDEHL